ncbi:hypothetical protein A4G20_03605 [Pasteurellaceae bacterium RH1A]|nr:hypothetical protein A4G20_03605 [Pasteurellaceae bacterium RH1A]
MKKPVYICLGFIFFGLGLIGIPTPGLPTTPFLLLALYFFSRSSPRLQAWFMGTKVYQKYLKDYDQNRAMTMKQKLTILLVSTPFSFFAVYALPHIGGKIAMVLVILVQYWYFFFKIKTIKP